MYQNSERTERDSHITFQNSKCILCMCKQRFISAKINIFDKFWNAGKILNEKLNKKKIFSRNVFSVNLKFNEDSFHI